jgi:thioester reductase-like protein
MSDAPSEPRDVLITGFPSTLAGKLIEVLHSEEPSTRVRLLVEDGQREEARHAVVELEADTERIDLVEGRIDGLDLGLSGTEFLDLLAHVTDIYHLASAIRPTPVDDAQRETILRATRNMADAASEMKKLRRFNHLSTAFVSGTRTGVIMEDELDEGQSFRNRYEETQFQAESVIQQRTDRLPISVYRPTLVLGDSRTGELGPDDGPYPWLQAMVQLPDPVPVPIPGRGHHPLNIVPVDFVANALHAISRAPDAEGQTFHLADPNPLSARRVMELVAEHAGKSATTGQIPYGLTRWLMRFPGLEKLTRASRQALDEFNQLTFFNSMNTVRTLGPDQQCPPFPTWVDRVVDFLQSSDTRPPSGVSQLSNLLNQADLSG